MNLLLEINSFIINSASSAEFQKEQSLVIKCVEKTPDNNV